MPTSFTELAFYIASNCNLPFVRKIAICRSQVLGLQACLSHGDFLFGRTYGALQNKLVPGHYQHVAVWDGENNCVMEFKESGYYEGSLGSFIARYTDVSVGSPKFDESYRTKFVDNLKLHSSKGYDTLFSGEDHLTYCSKAIYDADTARILGYNTDRVLFIFDGFVPDRLWTLPTVRGFAKITRPNQIKYSTEQ